MALDDRYAIDDLYMRYLWALDTLDTEAWIDTFVPDAEVLEDQPDGSTWKGRGPSALREFVEKYHHAASFPGHQHRETTRVFAPGQDRSGDRVAFRSYVFATRFHPGAPSDLYWSGWYRDVVVRTEAGWRFASRWIAPWKGDITTAGQTGPARTEGAS